MMDEPAGALLLETFGPRLLAYLSNVDEQQIGQRFREGTPLPEHSEAALQQLIPLAERVAQERLDRPGFPPWLSLESLGVVPDGAESSIGNIVRQSAGGDIELPPPDLAEDDDDVKSVLYRLCRRP